MAEKLKVPRHLGIIPDGNRRWARKRHLPTEEGHRRGYLNVREIVPAAFDRGVGHVSVYGFSTENGDRSPSEVTGLMKMLRWIAKKEIRSIDREDIKVSFAGNEAGLDDDIVKALREAEQRTAGNTRGEMVMCINYGGRQEIVDALRSAVERRVKPEEVTEELVAQSMYVPELPDMDLLVRTGGEQRISNFMLWQAPYTELMFSDKLWPDFTTADLGVCLDEFAGRDRRFGQ